MKSRIGATLFALPFLGVGLWAAWSVASNGLDAWQILHWVPVEAELIRAGYETHSGDDSDTYRAYAAYTYFYGGHEYQNDRVAIAGGSDNIGNFQRDLGERLQSAHARSENVVAYVNPDNPNEAILDRTPRWGLIGFKVIFLFLFGGIGLAMLIHALAQSTREDGPLPVHRDRPWLVNRHWQRATMQSGSKSRMVSAWAFAALWNLISLPLPFLIYGEFVEKGNKAALIGLLFPVVGMALLVWAIRQSFEWRRIGAAALTLDPFPGSIGGHVGGTIDLNLEYSAELKFALTLTSIHSYVSGSGEDSSRRETAHWQDTVLAHATPGPVGTRLSFRFDVPAGLAESDADRSNDDYRLWRLNLRAELPGVDIDRDYDIPVYATAEKSRHIADHPVQSARIEQSRFDEVEVRQSLHLSHDHRGRRLFYPMGRTLSAGIGGTFFGGVFAGIGWFLISSAGHGFMGILFGFVGSIILLSGLYFLFNSLEVSQAGDSIISVRRILGIPVRRRSLRRSDFQQFCKSVSTRTQFGSRHVLYYSIAAVNRLGQKFPIGDSFRGERQTDIALRIIGREFGLVEQSLRPVPAPDPGFDPLGPD